MGNQNPNQVKAKYVTEWDSGTTIRTKCLYDPETKKVWDVEQSDADIGDACLDREYIELPDGTEVAREDFKLEDIDF